jgi:hypothetical protein
MGPGFRLGDSLILLSIVLEQQTELQPTVAPVPVAAPTKRTPRWHRTGRTAQLNVRVRPAYFDKAYMLADSRGWLVGETIERALDALEREIGEGRHGS